MRFLDQTCNVVDSDPALSAPRTASARGLLAWDAPRAVKRWPTCSIASTAGCYALRYLRTNEDSLGLVTIRSRVTTWLAYGFKPDPEQWAGTR